MPLFFRLVAGLALLLLGCQAAPPAPLGAPELGFADARQAIQLRQAFLEEAGLPERLERLVELEGQALDLVEYEPLKLGALGSAILDLNYASLSGHYVLKRFYEHVDAAETAALHDAWSTAIKAAMVRGGAGALEDPYTALTSAEAQTYVRTEGLSIVGAVYRSSEGRPFIMQVQGRPSEGPLRPFHFALDAMHQAAKERFANQEAGMAFSPIALIGVLARQGDPAAQTALGALLVGRNRADDAIGWLQAGARIDNVVAHSLLARAHWAKFMQAESPEDKQAALDEVLENYLRAIDLGSSDAMHSLAAIYLRGAFGADNSSTAIALLNQAGELGNSDALHYLAYLHYTGQEVEQDLAKAKDYFIRSAALNNSAARLGYARYLLRERDMVEIDGDGRAVGWVKAVAEEQADPKAMVMLGNLHARGVGTKQNLRAAYKWYRNAAQEAPDSADIVNEVAWTLTVSDLERLRRARYANRIMTRLMESDDDARNQPEYLDTWAATYAARGDFGEAIRLQQLALQEAMDQGRSDVLDILQQHLDLFLDGKPVIEQAP